MLNDLRPIEREDTLADKAYERLRSALMSGSLRPGEALSIRQLAAMLKISATPARDAIGRVLWERGLESGLHRTVVVPTLTPETLADIYEVRLNLEVLAAGRAATRFTKADMDRLEKIEAAHLKAVGARNYSAALAQNEAFHFLIYRRAEDATLLELIRGLWLRLGPSFNLLYPSYAQDRRGVRDHAGIVEALRQGDPQRARAALEADLRDGWQELETVLASLHRRRSSGLLIASRRERIRRSRFAAGGETPRGEEAIESASSPPGATRARSGAIPAELRALPCDRQRDPAGGCG